MENLSSRVGTHKAAKQKILKILSFEIIEKHLTYFFDHSNSKNLKGISSISLHSSEWYAPRKEAIQQQQTRNNIEIKTLRKENVRKQQ